MNVPNAKHSSSPVLPVRMPLSTKRFSADQDLIPYKPIEVVSLKNCPAMSADAIPFGVHNDELRIIDRPRLYANARICAVSVGEAATAAPSPAFHSVKSHAPGAAPAAVPAGSNFA